MGHAANKITIATRKSPLALWQANWVKQQLQRQQPQLTVELLELVTQGDKLLDQPLTHIGGKGLFLKELELALLDGRADIAVHSMKDVPMRLPEPFIIAAILARANALDAFVSCRYQRLADLPVGACVGTSSARRKALLRLHYPKLVVQDIRGNVQTRLAKLSTKSSIKSSIKSTANSLSINSSTAYDGLILASAGLERLGLNDQISELLLSANWLPAPGQGAIGIECLSTKPELVDLVHQLNHQPSADCVKAERAVSRTLNGSCAVPLAAYAELLPQNEQLIELNTWVASPDHQQCIGATGQAPRDQAEQLGIELAQQLKRQGFSAWQANY